MVEGDRVDRGKKWMKKVEGGGEVGGGGRG